VRSADPLPLFAGEVALRRLAISDLSTFQAYRHDEVLGQYQGWSAMSDAEALDFLSEMNTATLLRPGLWSQVGIAAADSLRLIGDVGLLLGADGTRAEVGFTLARSAQGRGLATLAVREAIALVFQLSAARQILAATDARNIPSIRLLERVGMHRVESRAVVFRGEACVEYSYAISREHDA